MIYQAYSYLTRVEKYRYEDNTAQISEYADKETVCIDHTDIIFLVNWIAMVGVCRVGGRKGQNLYVIALSMSLFLLQSVPPTKNMENM